MLKSALSTITTPKSGLYLLNALSEIGGVGRNRSFVSTRGEDSVNKNQIIRSTDTATSKRRVARLIMTLVRESVAWPYVTGGLSPGVGVRI